MQLARWFAESERHAFVKAGRLYDIKPQNKERQRYIHKYINKAKTEWQQMKNEYKCKYKVPDYVTVWRQKPNCRMCKERYKYCYRHKYKFIYEYTVCVHLIAAGRETLCPSYFLHSKATLSDNFIHQIFIKHDIIKYASIMISSNTHQ